MPPNAGRRGPAAAIPPRGGGGTVFTPRRGGPAVIARRIVLEAMRAASGAYGGWRVGTTGDPRQSRRDHRSPPTWADWDAGSAEAARAVEGRLAALGMGRDSGAAGAAAGAGRHVYAFRA